MRIAIMQPYLFPYLGYFQLISSVDKFILYDDVQYINRGWINRNKILLSGKSFTFSFPLNKNKQKTLIKDKYFSNNIIFFKNKLLKTISSAYSQAPYYKIIYPLIKNIIIFPDNNLVNFIVNSLTDICNYLKITTPTLLSSSSCNNQNLKGVSRIISTINFFKANTYINSIGGKNIYNQEIFIKNNIKLSFLKMNNIYYKQLSDSFIPNLSIIDILMFNSKKTIINFLNKYTLLS